MNICPNILRAFFMLFSWHSHQYMTTAKGGGFLSFNKETGREIIVSKDGLGEWKTKSKSREQILSIKILDNLLKNSTYTHDAPDAQNRKNIEKMSYFSGNCKINDKEYRAVITIRMIKNYGDKYYHHYLEDIKIEPYSGITRPAGEPG
jgi:hypothetical protein